MLRKKKVFSSSNWPFPNPVYGFLYLKRSAIRYKVETGKMPDVHVSV